MKKSIIIATMTITMLVPMSANAQSINTKNAVNPQRVNVSKSPGQMIVSPVPYKKGETWKVQYTVPKPPAGFEYLLSLKNAEFVNGKTTEIFTKSGKTEIYSNSFKMFTLLQTYEPEAIFVKNLLHAFSMRAIKYVYPLHSKLLNRIPNSDILDVIKKAAQQDRFYENIPDNVAFRFIPATNELVFDIRYRESNQQIQTVHTKVKEILAQIIKPGMDVYSKELAINNWITHHIRYDSSKNGFNDTDYTAITQSKSQCVAISELAHLMLNSVGIKNVIVSGKMKTSRELHVWNEVKLNKKWYMLDVTWNLNPINYDYFNLTSAQLAKTHTWNQTGLPVANTNFITTLKQSKNPQDKQILRAIEG